MYPFLALELEWEIRSSSTALHIFSGLIIFYLYHISLSLKLVKSREPKDSVFIINSQILTDELGNKEPRLLKQKKKKKVVP